VAWKLRVKFGPSLKEDFKMQSRVKTALTAAALAGAAFCPGSASAFVFTANGMGTASFTIGDKMFSNFMCQPAGIPTTCAPGGLGVTYASSPTPSSPFTVTFNPNLTQGNEDVDLSYVVSTTNSQALINDFDLTSNATGTVNDTLLICNDPTDKTCTNKLVGPIALALSPPPGASFTFNFVPQSALFIQDDVSIPVGAGGSLSSLLKEVSQVPEPASLTLLATSLLGLGAALRRRRAK
jgi:PEP-CTERM motif